MSGTAVMIGGQLLQGVGAYAHGQDQAAMYRMEAAAKRAQAAQVQVAADREEAISERRYDKVRNAQLAAIGASGVQLRGSPLAQMEETAANHVSDVLAIRSAAGYRKSTLLTEGMLSDYASSQAESAGFLGFLGAGLGAVSKNPYTYDSGKASRGTAWNGETNIGAATDYSGNA